MIFQSRARVLSLLPSMEKEMDPGNEFDRLVLYRWGPGGGVYF